MMKTWLTRIAQLVSGRNKTMLIRDYILEGHKITPRDAIRLFDCYRLADVVFRLKKEGYNVVNLNKKGQYAQYVLEGKVS